MFRFGSFPFGYRTCVQVKLLFHRIRPVFVFDGGAPALKGRTLAARRKLRSEGTDNSVRKTAQRILAAQLKNHKVPYIGYD